MSTVRADTIINAAGTGAPTLSQGLRVTSILDTSGGNTATINGIVPISESMTLLGTLTTTSGSTQTLSSLNLSSYRYLIFDFNGVAVSGATSDRRVGGVIVNTTNNTVAMYGLVFVSLTTGRTWGAVGVDGGSGPTFKIDNTTYSTATTSVSVSTGGTFNSGSVRVYGVK